MQLAGMTSPLGDHTGRSQRVADITTSFAAASGVVMGDKGHNTVELAGVNNLVRDFASSLGFRSGARSLTRRLRTS